MTINLNSSKRDCFTLQDRPFWVNPYTVLDPPYTVVLVQAIFQLQRTALTDHGSNSLLQVLNRNITCTKLMSLLQ